MRSEGSADLEPLDPEIERTCRSNRKQKKKKANMANNNNNAGPNANVGADQNRALQEFAVPH